MTSLYANKVTPTFFITSHCVNMLRQKKMHLSCLIPFLIGKNHVILAINIVLAQIAILIPSSLSGTRFYVKRWVKYGRW